MLVYFNLERSFMLLLQCYFPIIKCKLIWFLRCMYVFYVLFCDPKTMVDRGAGALLSFGITSQNDPLSRSL